jgi:autotransporter-associated beta strand protein
VWILPVLPTAAALTASYTDGQVGSAPLTASDSITLSVASGAASQTGVISGTASVTKSGGGLLSLTGTNTFSGGTILSAGTLSLGSAGALGSSGAISFNGGILQATAANTTDYSSRFSAADAQQYAIDTNGQTVTWAGYLGSAGASLTKYGTGTLNLAGYAFFPMTVTLNGGNLRLGSTTAIYMGGSGGGAFIFNGGTLQYSAANNIDYSSRFSTAANQQFRVDTAGRDVTFATALGSSGGTFTKLGDGRLTLSQAATYTGVTTVNGGTLRVDGTLASPSVSIASGAVLELGTNYTGTGSAVTFSGAGTLRAVGSGASWTGTAATFALDSGSSIDVQSGTFVGGSYGNEVWTNNKSDLNVASGATFNGVEANVRVDALTGSGTIRSGFDNTQVFTFGVDGGSGTFSGTLADNTGGLAGNYTKAGSGTQALTGTNTYTGRTIVLGGTLLFGKRVSLYNAATASWTAANLAVKSGATAAFNVGGSGEFTAADVAQLTALGGASGGFESGSFLGFDTTNATGGVFTYSNAISNPNGGANILGVAKLGSGTLTLSGANTFTGGLAIRSGTLQIASDYAGRGGVAGTRDAYLNAIPPTAGSLALQGLDGTQLQVNAGSTLRGGTGGAGVNFVDSYYEIDYGASGKYAFQVWDNATAGAAGAIGASMGNGATVTISGTLSGGNGGKGGDGGDGQYTHSRFSGAAGGDGATALSFGTNGTLTNSGSILGGNGGAGGYNAGNGGYAYASAGMGATGVTMGDGAGITNSGTIAGGSGATTGLGLVVGNQGVLTNNGSIAGISAGNLFTVTNTSSGQISSSFTTGTQATIANAGLISTAMSLGSQSSVNNSGEIWGAVSTGAQSTITNSGSMPGGLAVSGSAIVNLGTIGSGGTAISMSGTTNSLEMRAGSSINGNVLANGTADTLTFGGATDSTFDLGALGVQYQGFESLSKTGSSSWSLGGTLTLPLAISGGSIQLTGSSAISGNISAAAGTSLVFNSSGGLAVSGVLSGAGTVEQRGSGTTTLSSANTFTGPTNITGGTLQFARRTSLYNAVTANWTAANLMVAPGATAAFNIGGTNDFTSLDIFNLASLGTATRGFQSGSFIGLDTTNAAGNSALLFYPISNPNGGANVLGLVKLGSGTLLLPDSSTYTGGLVVKSGTVVISSNSALGGNGSPLTMAGGTLSISGTTVQNFTAHPISSSFSGTIDIASAANTVTLSGALTGNLTKAGAGALVLGSGSSFTGPITLSQGGLTIRGSTSGKAGDTITNFLDSAAAAGGTGIEFAGSTTLQVDSAATVTGGGGTQTYLTGGSTFAANGGQAVTSQGATANVVNNGVITGGAAPDGLSSSFTPGYNAWGGPGGTGGGGVSLGNGSSLTNTNAISGASGGSGGSFVYTFAKIGSSGAGGRGGAGGVAISLGSNAIVSNSGAISGGNGGNGGSTSYYGNNTAGAAETGGAGLLLGSAGQITNTGQITGGSGGNGGTVHSSGSSYYGYGANGASGAVGVQVGTGSSLTNSGSIAGGAAGSGSVIYTKSFPWYLGTGGVGGTGLVLSDGSSLTNTGAIAGGAGAFDGRYYLDSATETAGGVAIIGSNVTIVNSGSISGGLFGGGVNRANALTLGGSANRLEIRPGSSIVGVVVANGASDTLAFGGTGSGTFDASALGDSAQYRGFENLEKTGSSTWTFTGVSSLTAGTTIAAGKLVVNGSLAGSAVTINNGGTLGGGGAVGAVSIASGGKISPGNSPGTLSTGSETWNAGGSYVWELNNASDSAAAKGVSYDWLNISGTLDIAATSSSKFTIYVTSLTADNVSGTTPGFSFGQTYQWTLATASAGLTNFSADKFRIDTSGYLNDPNRGNAFALSVVGNDLILTYTAVPEPGTWGMVLGMLMLGCALLRRHAARSHALTRQPRT